MKTNGYFDFGTNWDLQAGDNKSFMIDLNSETAISFDGQFHLSFDGNQFINTVEEAFGGNLKGYVKPGIDVKYIQIENLSTGKTFRALPELISGLYTFVILQPGNYRLTFMPKDENKYQIGTKDITVVKGQTADAGVFNLVQK